MSVSPALIDCWIENVSLEPVLLSETVELMHSVRENIHTVCEELAALFIVTQVKETSN